MWKIIFHRSLSDRNSPQDSRTLLSILAKLTNAIVWMVMILPPISNSSSPLTKPFGIVPSTTITTDITITFLFYSLFLWQGPSTRFSFCFLQFSLHGLSGRQNPLFSTFFFLLTSSRPGHLARNQWSVCFSKPHRILYISFSGMDSGLYIYYLVL